MSREVDKPEKEITGNTFTKHLQEKKYVKGTGELCTP